MTSHNTTASGADSHAQITSTTVYQHPAGGRVWVTSNGKIGITEPWLTTDEPEVAVVPIGVGGLKLLAYRLLTVAAEMEAAQ